jgi:hypothetical protein
VQIESDGSAPFMVEADHQPAITTTTLSHTIAGIEEALRLHSV